MRGELAHGWQQQTSGDGPPRGNKTACVPVKNSEEGAPGQLLDVNDSTVGVLHCVPPSLHGGYREGQAVASTHVGFLRGHGCIQKRAHYKTVARSGLEARVQRGVVTHATAAKYTDTNVKQSKIGAYQERDTCSGMKMKRLGRRTGSGAGAEVRNTVSLSLRALSLDVSLSSLSLSGLLSLFQSLSISFSRSISLSDLSPCLFASVHHSL